MSVDFKPLFVLFCFYWLTAVILYFILGTVIAATYLITGLISPFIILFIYWLIGEL